MTSTTHSRWTLILASLASFMAALDTLVVSTALDTIRLDLGATVEQLEWTLNGYNLSLAVLLMTAAALGDRFGRRALFAAGLGIFSLASAASALAPDAGWLIAARVVQGAGAALILTLSLALVSAAFPAERRGAALGIYMMLTGLAVGAGPVVGGTIAEGLAWQWIFWLNVPIGVLAIPLAFGRIRESFGPDKGIDLPGVGLIGAATFGVVWGLVRGNAAGWDSLEVLGAGVAGVALLAAFIAWELRAAEPMLPLRFFRSRAFSAGGAAVFLSYSTLFGAVFFFAQFLQVGLGHDPLVAGLMLVAWTGTLFFVAPVAGTLVDRYGERPFLAGGLTLQAIGMAWIALIADPGLDYIELVPPLVIAGAGISMSFPASQNAMVGSVPPEAIGKASGTNMTMRELGGVFGIAVLVAVFAGAGSYASPQEFVDGFAPAIGVGAGLSLLGGLIGLALPGGRVADSARPAHADGPRPQELGPRIQPESAGGS
jgi:EmrB/QacA subfamily drug resistance transporter